MLAEIVAVVLAGLVIAAYFERLSLRADAVAAKAEVVSAGLKFLTQLRTKESQVRAKVYVDVKAIVAECYTNIDGVIADAKAEEKAVAATCKAAVVQLEEKLKKVI